MKCWECKKRVNRVTEVLYCDGEKDIFRDVCEDCYQRLEEEVWQGKGLHTVWVDKLTQTYFKDFKRKRL